MFITPQNPNPKCPQSGEDNPYMGIRIGYSNITKGQNGEKDSQNYNNNNKNKFLNIRGIILKHA